MNSSRVAMTPSAAPTEPKPPGVRNLLIDALKGYAAILVILGHALPIGYPDSYTRNGLFIFIYAFHMPLFMFLSGYVYSGKMDEPLLPWVFRKFVKLIPVYIVWHVIFALFDRDPALFRDPVGFWTTAVLSPDAPWFMPILFFCLCGLAILAWMERRLGAWVWAGFFAAVVFLPWPSTFGLVKVKWFSFFLMAGYLAPSLVGWARAIVPAVFAREKTLDAVFLTLFPLLFLYRLLWVDMPGNVDFSRVNGWWREPGTWWIPYALALSGILFSFSLLRRMEAAKPLLAWFGKYSLELYLVHGLLLWVGFGGGAVRTASVTVLATGLSLIAILAIRKIPYAEPFFFGPNLKRKRPKPALPP